MPHRSRPSTRACGRGGPTGVTGIVVEARREREAFGYGPARLYVDFMAGEEIHRQDDAAWEQELDNWLVNEGARTQTPGGEVTRTMLRLSSRLAAVLRQVGDGYFRALLIRTVKDGPLGQSESVCKILADLREGTPYDDGKLAARIAEVDSVFTSIARELTDKLKYERDVAEEIFAALTTRGPSTAPRTRLSDRARSTVCVAGARVYWRCWSSLPW